MDELETALRAAAGRLPAEAPVPTLADRALRDGLVDVAYATADSPVGPLLLAATPEGIVRVGWQETADSVLVELAERISPRVLEAPARLDDARRQLDEYFAGRRTSFELPLDLQLSHGFRARAQAAIASIPFGRTGTYASIAAAAGSPRAVRAAGTACATNPIPVIVPCHRVVRSDGSMGLYGGGVERKRQLLELEHVL
jgi:methylated-DNA-[protein]-cysteine S-methyltransferase